MTTKQIALAIVLVFALGLSIGRFATPTKVETKTVTVEVEHKAEDKKVDKVTTITVKPDGTKTTTITDKTETTTKTDVSDIKTSSKLVENKHSDLNISVLAGVDITNPKIIYGASVTKGIIGPVSIGIWGLTNGTVGASVGLNF